MTAGETEETTSPESPEVPSLTGAEAGAEPWGSPATAFSEIAVTGAPALDAPAADAAAPGVIAPPATRSTARIDMAQVREEAMAWTKTLFSAAIYAVLIVTFGFQVARVEGRSMAPTLEDQDRLIVNKLVYRIADPRRGDIVSAARPSTSSSRV